MRKLLAPIVSLFIDPNLEHLLYRRTVGPLDAAVGAKVVRAGVDLVDTKAFVDGAGKVGDKL